MSVQTIVCVTDEEPACFHPDNQRGLAVRLSYRTDAAGEAAAQSDYEKFIDLLPGMLFDVYTNAGGGLERIAQGLAPAAESQGAAANALRGSFKTWLTAHADTARTKSGQDFFAAAPKPSGEQVVLTETHNQHAEHTLLAAASWTAPVPQKLGLACVLRMPRDPVNPAAPLVVLPYHGAGQPQQSYPAGAAAPGEAMVLKDYAAGLPGWHCETAVTKPLVLDSTEIDDATGFLKMAEGTEEGRRMLTRVEERGGALFSGYLPVRELCRQVTWPSAPTDAQSTSPEELQAARLLSWGAAASLASALDTVLIALHMPGINPKTGNALNRDGALLGLFLDLLDRRVAEKLKENAPGRGVLRATVREALRKMLPVQSPGQGEARIDWVNALAALCQLPETDSFGRRLLGAFGRNTEDGFKEIVLKARALVDEKKGGPRPQAPADALDQVLAPLHDTLTSEVGIEAAVVRLLSDPKVLEHWAALSQGDADRKKILLDEYQAALHDLAASFGAEFNGAQAARTAIGTLLADLLALQAPAASDRGTATQIRTAFDEWNFLPRRLGLTDGAPPPAATTIDALLAVLFQPAADLKAFIGADRDEFKAVSIMQSAVRDDLLPPAGGRFLPDHAPQPLPLRLSIDPAADDDDNSVDDFSASMAGVALLVRHPRTGAEWVYANLAELSVAGSPQPLDEFGMQAMPTSVSDGRRNMFVQYDGAPLASSAFDETITGGERRDWRPFVSSDYPEEHPGYAALPPLAYGTGVDVAAHVIGRAGSLPLLLQDQTRPWRATPKIDVPDLDRQNSPFVMSLPYSRRTAIGRASLALVRAADEEGGVLKGVKPLAMDYPRIGLASRWAQYVDLLRGADGSGLIELPADGQQSVGTLVHDLHCSGKTAATLGVSLLNQADAVPVGAADLELSLPTGPCGDLACSIVRTKQGSYQLEVKAAGQTRQVELRPASDAPAWFRLQLQPGNDGDTALSLADPAQERAGAVASAARPAPDNLVLLGASTKIRPDLWRAPFRSQNRIAVADYPRVGYLDFTRWCANPELRKNVFGALPLERISRFRVLLLAAYIGRHTDNELSELLERLPDPAVCELGVDLLVTDTLAAAPGQLPTRFRPASRVLPAPALGELLARGEYAAALDAGKIKTVLRLLDAHYRHRFELRTASQDDDNAVLALGSDGTTVTLPAGVVARLTVRPRVRTALFAGRNGDPAAIDPRLLQWAAGYDTDRATVNFEGASMQIETMIGPLGQERPGGWRMGREGWVELSGRCIARRIARGARQYQWCAEAGAADWQWRQLGGIDVATQRWRFSGHPIYAWFNPHELNRDGQQPEVGITSVEVRAEHPSYRAFESQAFYERDPLDAEVESTPLLPMPAATTVATVVWEQPDATLFRHRFVVRSRYAGAMRDPADAQCDTWIKTDADSVAAGDADVLPGAWRRVVMLGERTRLPLVRPQVRALLPSTTSPEPDVPHSTPPLIAILQEPPFSGGGLAARVCAEIRTGIGYELKAALLPHDARKELGPDPRLSYLPFPARQARQAVLSAEGPIGLSFDSSVARAPAFPNSAVILTVEQAGAQGLEPVSVQEHFMSVVLQRYLDPNWLVPEASPDLADDKKPIVGGFGVTWWIDFPARDGTLVLAEGDGQPALAIAACVDTGDELQVRLNWPVIDPTVNSASAPDIGDPVAKDVLILCGVARAAASAGTLAFLHTPLDEQRANLSVFLVWAEGAPGAGMDRSSGNAPVLLGSLEWTVPPGFQPDRLRAAGAGAHARAIGASATTALQWTRTNRNFDTVLIQRTNEQVPVGVSDLAAKRKDAKTTLYEKGKPDTPVWVRTLQGTQPFPVHAQRHMAVLTSRIQSALGRSIEVPLGAGMASLRALTLGEDDAARKLRFIEFETPAAILGYGGGADVPEHYTKGYLDLTACGYDRAGPAAGVVDLSLFIRLVGSPLALAQLVSLELELQAGPTMPPVRATFTPSGKTPAFALSADVVVAADGTAAGFDSHVIHADGSVVTQAGRHWTEPATGNPVASWPVLPPEPDGRAQQAGPGHGLAARIIGAKYADGIDRALWLEIALLASARRIDQRRRGFLHAVDFDWFFGREAGDVNVATTPAGLRNMREAQARIVSVSQNIDLLDQ